MPQRGAVGSKLFLFRLSYAVLYKMRPFAKWNSIGIIECRIFLFYICLLIDLNRKGMN